MSIKNILKISFLSIILIVIDQVSKHFFYDKLFLNDLSIIQPVFNAGISRSIPIPQVVIIVLTFLILGLLVYLYYKKQISKWSTIFLIGGAVSNLIDRVFLGGVRDFILLFKRFPIFNLADVFINTGVVLIVLKELFGIGQKYSGKRKNY
ncbi:MAG TPA: signal peptidase II [Candidatus Absconditabacterales bacterium]|nr:signal peptidase II [Candidatus Absconditabacterales bacterium]HOQ78640.1 signal peptidase II [Candidatus Absconditabacterales bacterium]HPK28062.1 signal peptidase II [Candidatus Absconditabacterales bacterium]